jgi:predicted metal-dependent RNase
VRQQRIRSCCLQNGRDVIVNLCPTINIENIAPLLEKGREQMVFMVLEQFVSELSTLGVCLVYFSGNLFRKRNVREVLNHYLFMCFKKRVFIQCIHIDIVSHN